MIIQCTSLKLPLKLPISTLLRIGHFYFASTCFVFPVAELGLKW
jgi:hypothetical protein